MTKKKKVKGILDSTKGRFFTVRFIKKDGELRIMNARTGVTKGVKGQGLKFNPDEYDLYMVWDTVKGNYRFINLETVLEIHANGQTYVFEDAA